MTLCAPRPSPLTPQGATPSHGAAGSPSPGPVSGPGSLASGPASAPSGTAGAGGAPLFVSGALFVNKAAAAPGSTGGGGGGGASSRARSRMYVDVLNAPPGPGAKK